MTSVSVLQAIVAAARRSANERMRARRTAVDRQTAGARPTAGAFVDALRSPEVRIIAECKRRSPSRGILRREYDPAAIAAGYERAGAAAISVLTEPTFFDGSLDHLRAVRAVVRAPILLKDFVVTDFQIVEGLAAGADAVLLIVAALGDAELKGLIAVAGAHGVAALVEVHSPDELRRAIDAGATVVGVNSRDLRTLEVIPSVFDAIADLLPRDIIAIAESGLTNLAAVTRLRAMRYDAFLIGERFMSAADPGIALKEFLAADPAGGAA